MEARLLHPCFLRWCGFYFSEPDKDSPQIPIMSLFPAPQLVSAEYPLFDPRRSRSLSNPRVSISLRLLTRTVRVMGCFRYSPSSIFPRFVFPLLWRYLLYRPLPPSDDFPIQGRLNLPEDRFYSRTPFIFMRGYALCSPPPRGLKLVFFFPKPPKV